MTAWDDTEELEELKIAYEELKSENEKLRDAYDTDALTISYNLGYTCGKDIAKDEIERLRKENERLEDTRIEFIGMINKLIDERVKMRKALNPFAYYASQIPDDVSDTASASGTVGDLRAAAAALKESGDE